MNHVKFTHGENGTRTEIQVLFVGFFLGAVIVFAFGAAFLFGADFFGFAAAALALAEAVVPVTAFFAGARFEAVVVFFACGAALALATVFFAGAAFLEGTAFLVVVVLAGAVFLAAAVERAVPADLEGAAFLVTVVFVAAALTVADFGLLAFFAAGLFSLASPSPALVLGASLTRPEGPFGKKKNPLFATRTEGLGKLSILSRANGQFVLGFDVFFDLWARYPDSAIFRVGGDTFFDHFSPCWVSRHCSFGLLGGGGLFRRHCVDANEEVLNGRIIKD